MDQKEYKLLVEALKDEMSKVERELHHKITFVENRSKCTENNHLVKINASQDMVVSLEHSLTSQKEMVASTRRDMKALLDKNGELYSKLLLFDATTIQWWN